MRLIAFIGLLFISATLLAQDEKKEGAISPIMEYDYGLSEMRMMVLSLPAYSEYEQKMDNMNIQEIKFRLLNQKHTQLLNGVSNHGAHLSDIQFLNKAVWKLNNRVLVSGGTFGKNRSAFNLNPDNLRGVDLYMEYRITDKLYFQMSSYAVMGNWGAVGYSDATMNPAEIYPRISFDLTKSLKVSGGPKRTFDSQTGKWKTSYAADLIYKP